MQKPQLISIALIVAFLCTQVVAESDGDQLNHQKNIKENLEKFGQEPNNCLYIEQVAASYNALGDYDKAIEYYHRTLSLCPDNFHALFQIGTCLYRKGEKDSGFAYMEKAIDKADEIGAKDFHEQYKLEKKAWADIEGYQ